MGDKLINPIVGLYIQYKLGGGFNNFYFHPYLLRWSNLTHIFELGWNHQLVRIPAIECGMTIPKKNATFNPGTKGWELF